VNRDKWVKVKVWKHERDAWYRAADVEGLSLADLIRQRMGDARLSLERKPKPVPVKLVDPEMIRELGRIGNNLNQVARWANYYKADADAEQVLAVLLAIERDLSEIRADFAPRRKQQREADDAD
jgi:hypothetical protein